MQLSAPAQRVLGALIEKALATPQNYPLSLNALRSAANQRNSRDPVTDYDEGVLRQALAELSEIDVVRTVYTGSRTPKYEHHLDDYLEIGSAAVTLLALLMLRGPQTLGELRGRSERMHAFADLDDVEATLRVLTDHPIFGALVQEVPRQPGQKEGRWQHLLGDPLEAAAAAPTMGHPLSPPTPSPGAPAVPAPVVQPDDDDVAALRADIADLRDELETLAAEVERLRRRVEG